MRLPKTTKPESLAELHRRGTRMLGGSPTPWLDALVLLLHAGLPDKAAFYTHPELVPTPRLRERYLKLVARRAGGVPLAYVRGFKEFWSLGFRVGPGVLIPRPETEALVEKAVSLAGARRCAILDVGTGSGNVAVALAKELPQARITATDVSSRALRYAVGNARRHGFDGIRFVRGDLFSAFGRSRPLFDLIVSNPPYIARGEWDLLPSGVRDHEPRLALVGGGRGTDLVERLVREGRRFLKPRGRLLLEIGAGQKEAVVGLFGEEWDEVEVVPDLAGIPRVIAARKAAARRRRA